MIIIVTLCSSTPYIIAIVSDSVVQCQYSLLASQVLLATLAIPIVPVSLESTRFLQHDNFVHEKDRRLASLLRLSVTPTRHSLHKDLVSV